MRVLDEKYLIRPIQYKGIQRIEPLEIPEEALREIICNAIVHRDHQGTWTQMSIYSDHIRLWNEGRLPDDMPLEKLFGKHTSKPRNPKMAEAFYRAGFIEAWGRGIEKVIAEFNDEGLVPPTFIDEQGGLTVNIRREKFMAVNLRGTSNINRHIPNKPEQNRTKSNKTEQKNKILELITKSPSISRKEIARIMGIHESSVQRRLVALVNEGCIKRIGSTKGGYWEVINE